MSGVVVIGAGIVGAAVAERLSREGHDVTLVERGEVGREASWAAAGLLTPVHPWNYPESMLALDDESLERWPDLAERIRTDTGVDIEMRRTGLLALIESEDDDREADRRIAWKRARGERVERLDNASARALEATLPPDVRGALRFPDLCQVRNHRVAPGLAAAAARRGADVREHETVLGFLREGGRVIGVRTTGGIVKSEFTVLAAGAWSGGLLGERAPRAVQTRPARGQMLLLRTRPGTLKHMILGSAGGYLVPRADGRILAGSTVEYAGFDHHVTVEGLRGIAATVEELTPGLGSATIEGSWAGLRPDTPDHFPVFGEIEPGLIAATGHFRSGIILAPVSAQIVLELVAGDASRDLAPFAPRRSA